MNLRRFLATLALAVVIDLSKALDSFERKRRPPPPPVVVAVEVEGLEELEELEAMIERVKDAYSGAADAAERFAETTGLREASDLEQTAGPPAAHAWTACGLKDCPACDFERKALGLEPAGLG